MGDSFQSENWPDALKIRTKDGQLKPFVPTELQKLLVKRMREVPYPISVSCTGRCESRPMDVTPNQKED